MNIDVHNRVVFIGSDHLPDTVSFVATLGELDQGGATVSKIHLYCKNPEDLIDLGKDLMLAGAELRQYVEECPFPKAKPEIFKEAANGHVKSEAA